MNLSITQDNKIKNGFVSRIQAPIWFKLVALSTNQHQHFQKVEVIV